jgi:hypothetical protein
MRADVSWTGGVTGVLKTAHLAEAFGMNCEIHTAIFHPLEMVNLHLCAAVRNCSYLELLGPSSDFAFGLTEPLPISNGIATLARWSRPRPRPRLGPDRKRHDGATVSHDLGTDNRLILLDDAMTMSWLRARRSTPARRSRSRARRDMPATSAWATSCAAARSMPASRSSSSAPVIGSASRDIALGEHVHLQNLKSNYTATHSLEEAKAQPVGRRSMSPNERLSARRRPQGHPQPRCRRLSGRVRPPRGARNRLAAPRSGACHRLSRLLSQSLCAADDGAACARIPMSARCCWSRWAARASTASSSRR